MKIQNRWVVTEFKLLDSQGRMTSAVDTGIATIKILVLFMRRTRTLVRCCDFRKRQLRVRRIDMILHSMSTFMHAIDHNSQHDQEEEPGNEM